MKNAKWEDGPIMEVASEVAEYLGLGARSLDEFAFEVLREMRRRNWWPALYVAELGAWRCCIWNQWDEEGEGSEVLGSGSGTDPAEAIIRAVRNKKRLEEELLAELVQG